MKAFEYVNPKDVKSAVGALTSGGATSKLIAGGIDLLGELKDYIRTPDVVVNLKSIPGLNKMTADATGLRIGALVTLTELVENATVRQKYTALSEAANSVGTLQIRNVGTIGGNLCQRPRCWYYRDAVEGENQYHAILGGGPSFIIHPSDCAPALIALNASVEISGPKGDRRVPLEKFFILPAENIFRETILQPNELVTHVVVPPPATGSKSHYMKIRHKESFDWALAGAAVSLTMAAGLVKDARVVLSGVAPIPWRSLEAETLLRGHKIDAALADKAGAAAVAKAKPMRHNGYKVQLTHNTVMLAIMHAAGIG